MAIVCFQGFFFQLRFGFTLQERERQIEIDWEVIDKRLSDLDDIKFSSLKYRKKNSLSRSFLDFLRASQDSPTLMSCTPNDIRRFLVWKDSKGKTMVHNINCENLGLKGNFECGCPNRVAS